MLDLEQNTILKLTIIPSAKILPTLHNFLLEGEFVFAAAKSHRDQVIFTSKRIIVANVQGLTGKKVSCLSLPYAKIQVFSIGNSGTQGKDCELEIFVAPFDKLRFEIKGSFDMAGFNKVIGKQVLD